ncbi:MAG: T9SS type A sorting domain-containing protein, partial [Saprospiraceae bacterium]
GGTPPYAYQWSNGTNANCTTLSGGGMLGLTVTDARGCTKSANAVITQPPAIVLTTAVTHESAPNANNGAINLTVVSGGVGQVFVYAWSNGAQTQDLAGLAGGTYTVTVTDATTGCTQTASATVLTTVGTEEAVLFAQFLLSPNPTEGLALLSLKLHEAAALRVEIRDVAGRLVWENPVLETDALNLPIDLTQSPAGMYTVSVWVGTQVFVRKLAIAR